MAFLFFFLLPVHVRYCDLKALPDTRGAVGGGMYEFPIVPLQGIHVFGNC